MSDESNVASRIVRWGAVAVLIAVSIGLYFRLGTHIPPLTVPTQGAGAGAKGGEGTAVPEPTP
ncbi:MAG TPA: hypothetical protein VLV16_12410 [Gemmatimonadales bacterium]|nr:hypothetical protein [Gemmatimonadales bacterium]